MNAWVQLLGILAISGLAPWKVTFLVKYKMILIPSTLAEKLAYDF